MKKLLFTLLFVSMLSTSYGRKVLPSSHLADSLGDTNDTWASIDVSNVVAKTITLSGGSVLAGGLTNLTAGANVTLTAPTNGNIVVSVPVVVPSELDPIALTSTPAQITIATNLLNNGLTNAISIVAESVTVTSNAALQKAGGTMTDSLYLADPSTTSNAAARYDQITGATNAVMGMVISPTWNPYIVPYASNMLISLADGGWQYVNATGIVSWVSLPAAATNQGHSLRLDILKGTNSLTIYTNNLVTVTLGNAYVTNSGVGALIFDKPYNAAAWKAYTLP